ncbi:MAG: THUMP domain-containing protein [Candidatus Hadarchaeales archaeon]
MRLVFFLSGEHPQLPRAEVLGALQAEGASARVLEEFEQVLVVETEADPVKVASRLGMSHEVWMHLCTSRVEELLEAVASTDVVDLMPHGRTFAVRVERVGRSSPLVSREKLSKEVADLLRREVGFKVDLERPEVELSIALTGEVGVVGMKLASTARNQLMSRRPRHRRAFHPSTLHPALARCMVNLARAPRGGTLLDPFCGVGGILIEAGLMGMRVVGVDLDPEMVEKARMNLEGYGVRGFRLEVGDACEWKGKKVDAVATDPPYGRQASTWRREVKELYRRALPVLAGALKRGRYMCLTSPSELDLGEMAAEIGLKERERYEQRVHRSLTRRIYVFGGLRG